MELLVGVKVLDPGCGAEEVGREGFYEEGCIVEQEVEVCLFCFYDDSVFKQLSV